MQQGDGNVQAPCDPAADADVRLALLASSGADQDARKGLSTLDDEERSDRALEEDLGGRAQPARPQPPTLFAQERKVVAEVRLFENDLFLGIALAHLHFCGQTMLPTALLEGLSESLSGLAFSGHAEDRDRGVERFGER